MTNKTVGRLTGPMLDAYLDPLSFFHDLCPFLEPDCPICRPFDVTMEAK